VNAKEARTRVDAARAKRREKERAEQEALRRFRKSQVQQLIAEVKENIGDAVEDVEDWADTDIELIWERPSDVQEVIEAIEAEGYTVSVHTREERDYDEPGRAPDEVHYLRAEW
jgi:hypothetical protein